MNIELNKVRLQILYDEVFNAGNLAAADALIDAAAPAQEALPRSGGLARESVKQLARQLRAAFPDLCVKVHEMAAEGDRVMARVTMTGTQRGCFWGVPASGRRLELELVDLARFADGKIIEHRTLGAELGLRQFAGSAPSLN